MRKRWLSLLLALVMLASVTVTTASADTVNLLDKTVTLSVTPSQRAICVGSTGDVYVTYTISIKADAPIPAFQFRLPADAKLATQVQSNDSNWYYWFNTDELMQWDEAKKTGGHGPYKVADYTKSSGYVGVGGSDDGKGLTSVTVMTTVAKFDNSYTTGSYNLSSVITDFVAGGTKNDGGVNTANAFGNCVVNGATVTVNPGATVSGTVNDSSGKAVSGAAVELYKDGKAVAKEVTTGVDGKYTFSDVSTGTYTVKAKRGDGSLNGSAEITVKADSILNADVTVAKGVTVSGTIKSYGGASEAVTVTLTPSGGGTPFTDTLTGNSANYSFSTVPAGTYTLKVEKKGHAPWTEKITVGSSAVTKDVTIYLWGDVNRDGKVTAADAQEIQRNAAKLSSAYDTEPNKSYWILRADVNRDGKVTAADAQEIQRNAAKLSSAIDSLL